MASFIFNARLMCGDDKNKLVFGAEFLTPENITADEIRRLAQEWVLTKPFIVISNTMHQVDPYCSITVENLGDTTCEAVSPTESEPESTVPRFTLLEIISVVVMALLLIIVIISCVIIACLIRRICKTK